MLALPPLSLAGCQRRAPSLRDCHALAAALLGARPGSEPLPAELGALADGLAAACLTTPCPRDGANRPALLSCARRRARLTGDPVQSLRDCCIAARAKDP